MAIPEGRLSTDWAATEGAFTIPEDRAFYAYVNYERGPIAIEDTSEGLLYQNWTFSWDSGTGLVTATPETTGSPSVIPGLSIPACSILSCTFDQNGRVSVAYINGNGYLFWYDTDLATTVTTDLGTDIRGIALYLDDKRSTQNAFNDMLLWYTKVNGPVYDLYMLRQRDRFLTEYLMTSGLELYHIHNTGMSSNLRGQLTLKSAAPFT